MSFEDIIELINTINESQISFMELNYDKVYLKLDKSLNRNESVLTRENISKNDINSIVPETRVVEEVSEISTTANLSEKINNTVIEDDKDAKYIVSPMVGTVYLSPSPGKAPYATNGQYVKIGDVVCIVEAMKLMNEIESEYSGKIVEILVEDGQMVEYGQKLFKLKNS